MNTIDSIRTSLDPVFREYNVKWAILFGSFANGIERPNSDIDIFIDRGLRGLRFYGLLEDVVTTLERPVNLIDASQVREGSKVLDEINRTGILIYGK